jgi:hypothetical protein
LFEQSSLVVHACNKVEAVKDSVTGIELESQGMATRAMIPKDGMQKMKKMMVFTSSIF